MPVIIRSEHIEELRKELAELDARAGIIRRMLDGYEAEDEYRRMRSGSTASAPAINSDIDVEEEMPMTAAVELLLAQSAIPLTIAQIKSQLMQNEFFAERLSATPNYLYSLLFRLTKGDRLKRVGERYTVGEKARTT